jgi:hypothetical protein
LKKSSLMILSLNLSRCPYTRLFEQGEQIRPPLSESDPVTSKRQPDARE